MAPRIRFAPLALLAIAATTLPWGVSSQAQGGSDLPYRLAIPFVATDRAEHPVEAPFRAARGQWDAAGIDDYTIAVSIARFGPHERHTVTVEGGEVVSIESSCNVGPDPWECGEVIPERFTVPGLFERIAKALANIPPVPAAPFEFPGSNTLDATFVAPVGLPVRIVTGHTAVADLGEALTVESFDLPDAHERLALARATWDAHAWYEYSARTASFDPTSGATESRGVHVRDGAIIDSSTECGDGQAELQPCDLDPGAEQAAVEGMFDLVEALLDDGAVEVTVLHYNIADGHVERIFWGESGAEADAWRSVQVVQFDPLH